MQPLEVAAYLGTQLASRFDSGSSSRKARGLRTSARPSRPAAAGHRRAGACGRAFAEVEQRVARPVVDSARGVLR